MSRARLIVTAEQLLEEGPEVDHGLAQVFGARLVADGAARDLVGRPVVLDHDRMLDGDVRGAAIEILRDGIATLAHHLADERVGLADRRRRLIDERALRPSPALGEALARLGLELADLELLMSLTPLAQLALGRRRSPRSASARPYSGPKPSCSCCERR